MSVVGGHPGYDYEDWGSMGDPMSARSMIDTAVGADEGDHDASLHAESQSYYDEGDAEFQDSYYDDRDACGEHETYGNDDASADGDTYDDDHVSHYQQEAHQPQGYNDDDGSAYASEAEAYDERDDEFNRSASYDDRDYCAEGGAYGDEAGEDDEHSGAHDGRDDYGEEEEGADAYDSEESSAPYEQASAPYEQGAAPACVAEGASAPGPMTFAEYSSRSVTESDRYERQLYAELQRKEQAAAEASARRARAEAGP